MSISKTRQMFVDVARQIFAKKGIANTTMNDIAAVSYTHLTLPTNSRV